MYWPTWFGGARRVVATGIGSGRGRLNLRGRRSGGGLVQADFGFELWEAPPSVDVLKLLNLCTKSSRLAMRSHFSKPVSGGIDMMCRFMPYKH